MHTMREMTKAEAAMVAGAPGKLAAVVEETFWPEIRGVALGIVERPGRVRKIPAKQLEQMMDEVEKVGGVGAVLDALKTDKRRCAEHLSLDYVQPIATVDESGNPIEADAIIRELHTISTRPSKSAVRDVLRRLDRRRRAELLDAFVAAADTPGGRWVVTGTWMPEAARFVVDGEIEMSDLRPETQDVVLSISVSAALHRFKPEHIVESLCRGANSRSVDALIQVLWSEGGPEYLEAVARAWREGRFNEVVERNILKVLAAKGPLTDEELARVAAQHLGQSAYMVVAQLSTERGEVVLRNLPESVSLPDITDLLEGAAGRSTWALCEIVKRGRTTDVARWMRKNGSAPALYGERGLAVIETVLKHWEPDMVAQLCADLASQQFAGDRPEIKHLALHSTEGVRLLSATGTLGAEARGHCYQTLGTNKRGWDYLRGLLPTWRGSIWQLCRAAEKMTRSR